jgi:DNA-binding MarR family transcriptional regulator
MEGVNGVNGSGLPPSAQTVLLLLDDGVPRTFKDITHETDIAPRTVRYAIKRLKDSGLIVEKFNFRDARQIIYQRHGLFTHDDEESGVFAV